MAALHYQRRRSPAEQEVDAAVARALDRYHELEARLYALDDRIAETRRMAVGAGIFDPRIEFKRPQPAARRERIRGTQRAAARAALARAALHKL